MIVCFLVCLILFPFGESIDGTFLMLVLGLSMFGLFLGSIFQFRQYISFQKAKTKQRKFFSELKRDIINSNSYEELITLQASKIKN